MKGPVLLRSDTKWSPTQSVNSTTLSYYSHCALRIELQTSSAPTQSLIYILCILMLICCYMFQRNRHLQGDYTNVVKKFCNKIIIHIKYAHLTYTITIKLLYCFMF